MISTGNDIVALDLTDQERTCRYRFYSRILTAGELALYDGFVDGSSGRGSNERLAFSSFVWLMWSIKESVYKYVSRSNPQLVFAPLKIPVSRVIIRDNYYEGVYYEGTVRHETATLYSRSFHQDGRIMTVLSEERDFSLTRWGVHAIGDSEYSSQVAKVRMFALHSLSAVFPGAALRIVKTPDGPPEVWDGERILDVPVSLAHHGRYVAWSYRLNSSSYRKSAAN